MRSGYAPGTTLRGWALTARDLEPEAGPGPGDEGHSPDRAGGPDEPGAPSGRGVPADGLGLPAEAYAQVGQREATRTSWRRRWRVNDHEERRWEAEVCRLKGELLLAGSAEHATEAEACLHQALDIARRQQAKSWELRAAMSLARLWQRQGKRTAADELLAPIYGWFTEGFDTADLQEAKALLEELSRSNATNDTA